MNADSCRWEIDQIAKMVIGCVYTVGNSLGSGFLEKVYENALAHEIRKTSFGVAQQVGIDVIYDGVVVGEYVADMTIGKQVMVELKAVKALDDVHMA